MAQNGFLPASYRPHGAGFVDGLIDISTLKKNNSGKITIDFTPEEPGAKPHKQVLVNDLRLEDGVRKKIEKVARQKNRPAKSKASNKDTCRRHQMTMR